ncbi:glycosyltransferase family 2 protein [Streptomyces sp. DT2A-34]|uniref:glycosyltransferase family 2 protein n=1 Tax=Streptomyces sp. DT2A-34 TaxID=3051182 RepID=UPI00265C1DEA|nr:glycosyltransferase family 2 protein [Streptomyces sp. DT2A-34]MDO0914136.1 glycosyltransferase family 2 protein [Streptomyces sp. DT2A-34]
MLINPPPLIAVIGPVEVPLLAAWVRHYRLLGIERFLIAFHFPEHVPDQQRQELQAASRELGIIPTGTTTGPWHEHTNGELRQALRQQAGPGWHLLADADEFQQYPAPLDEVIAQAEHAKNGVVGGLMLDRISADGSLTGWDPQTGSLDTAYPLGGFLTHQLLRGDPRKIVLAHSSVSVASGSHRAEGHRPANRPPVAVHHFKWHAGVRQDIERRAVHSADGTWKTASPARLAEARRLLQHLHRHGGRIAAESRNLDFRLVSLQTVPDWWAERATRLVTTWRPPGAADQSQPGVTISSPSPSGGSNRA